MSGRVLEISSPAPIQVCVDGRTIFVTGTTQIFEEDLKIVVSCTEWTPKDDLAVLQKWVTKSWTHCARVRDIWMSTSRAAQLSLTRHLTDSQEVLAFRLLLNFQACFCDQESCPAASVGHIFYDGDDFCVMDCSEILNGDLGVADNNTGCILNDISNQ